MRIGRVNIAPFLILGIPLVIYTIHALYFNTWIVDDAGITFAYARSFAQGYGLVSQPGMVPVEGYSNTAWLLLLTPFFMLNLFDPVVTPKMLSVLLVAASFFTLYRALRLVRGRDWVVLTGLTLTALNTSFVVWTISGLENPLYLLLVCLMLWQTIRVVLERELAARNAVLLGILAALAGMTRPDGLAYVLTFPVILIPVGKIGWKRKWGLLLAYGAAFAVVYGGFIAFRMAYFGAPLPNTYYMKGGPGLEDVIGLLTMQSAAVSVILKFPQSMFGSLKDAVLITLAVMSVYLVIRRRWTGYLWVVLVFLMCSLAIYVLLPPDWMGEYRFATALILLLYLYAALMVNAVLKQLSPTVNQGVAIALTALAIGGSAVLFAPRSEVFRNAPTVPFQYVKAAFADRFNEYKQVFGLDTASVLLPDVGGMLYYSDLMVYDLAGLTDRTIAQNLGTHISRPVVYEYVFETIRPTFIHMHGYWTALARLYNDPRFAELYMPICAFTDEYILETYRQTVNSGDFVLRSVAENRSEAIAVLRQSLNDDCSPK